MKIRKDYVRLYNHALKAISLELRVISLQSWIYNLITLEYINFYNSIHHEFRKNVEFNFIN